jgi:hypothetical protein
MLIYSDATTLILSVRQHEAGTLVPSDASEEVTWFATSERGPG